MMKDERGHTGTIDIRRSRHKIGRGYLLCIVAVILIICACTVFGLNISAHSNHTEEPVNFTYYKSISIEHGDTLWDIAEEYMTEEYESVDTYVDAIKEMNNLYTDDIHAGQNLMVAYNDTEFINQ